MHRGFLIFAICLICVVFVALFIPDFNTEGPSESMDKSNSATADSSLVKPTPSDVAPVRVRTEDDLARTKELEKMESDLRQEQAAALKTREARIRLQLLKSPEWRKVVEQNMEKFEALRVEAAKSPEKIVPCTICDAQGVLHACVICDRSGKCPTCRGSGKFFEEVCPTCQRGGKCFLCSGSGKMPCPFCQSSSLAMESITPTTPAPPAEIPIGMPKEPSIEK
jgi:hypothetical protein